MDLSTLTPLETVELVLKHPKDGTDLKTESGAPISITIYGRDSAVFQKHEKALSNRRIQQQVTNRRAKITAEQIEEENIGTLAACVASWSNIELDGATLECTRQNAKMLLGRMRWIREQLDEAIADRANFFKD